MCAPAGAEQSTPPGDAQGTAAQTAHMGRRIFVGDIQGCREPLERLHVVSRCKRIQPLFKDFAGQLSARVDTQQTHSAQLIYPITNHWSVSAQYQRVQNKSNIPLYDYVQNVWTGLVTWTY